SDRYEYMNTIELIDEKGAVRMTTREFPAPDLNVATREHFEMQRKRDAGLQVSPVLARQTGDEPGIVLSRRISGSEGEFRGAAFVVLGPAYFERVYKDVRVRYGSEIELFRNDLALLARYPRSANEGERARIDDQWVKKAPVRGLVDASWPPG